MRSKKPLKTTTKKLLRKAMNLCEKEMKASVHRRAKETCELCGIRGVPMDVDHYISRKNKSTYYDINNLTLLCKGCHTKKSFGHQDYHMKVIELVFEREGFDVCQELREKSRKIKKYDADELIEMAESYKKLWK